MASYNPDWTRAKGWNVESISPDLDPTDPNYNPWGLKSTDNLTFEGDGKNGLDTDAIKKNGETTPIAKKCKYNAGDTVSVRFGGFDHTITHTITMTVNRLTCEQASGGTVWTATSGG